MSMANNIENFLVSNLNDWLLGKFYYVFEQRVKT